MAGVVYDLSRRWNASTCDCLPQSKGTFVINNVNASQDEMAFVIGNSLALGNVDVGVWLCSGLRNVSARSKAGHYFVRLAMRPRTTLRNQFGNNVVSQKKEFQMRVREKLAHTPTVGSSEKGERASSAQPKLSDRSRLNPTSAAAPGTDSRRVTAEGTALESFYAARSLSELRKVYGDQVKFEDPVFGKLEDNRALAKWMFEMASPDLHYTREQTPKGVNWVARYTFDAGPLGKRKVVNQGVGTVTLSQDGKIARHADNYDVRAWAKQALGPILGSVMPKFVLAMTAQKKLAEFIEKYQLTDIAHMTDAAVEHVIATERRARLES